MGFRVQFLAALWATVLVGIASQAAYAQAPSASASLVGGVVDDGVPVSLDAGHDSANGIDAAATTPKLDASRSDAELLADSSAGAVDAAAEAQAPSRVVVNAGLGTPPENVLRETPRQTVMGFMNAAANEDFETAAHYLYLRNLSAPKQRSHGPELARQLAEVFDRKVWFDTESISDDARAGAAEGESVPKEVTVATIELPNGSQGIRLARVRAADGAMVWVFSEQTVQSVKRLHELYGLPDIVRDLPRWTRVVRVLGMPLWQWGGMVLMVAAAWALGLALERPVLWFVRRVAKRRGTRYPQQITRVAEGPSRLILFLLLLLIGMPWLRLPLSAFDTIQRFIFGGLVFAAMWIAIGVIGYAATVIQDATKGDELRARVIATRVHAIRRIATVLIVVVAIALALMQFPFGKSVGLSLLGSAGLAGAILGFAAQKIFANLFAGILISLTQPIRIGDLVVVENQTGTIEDIGTTHVLVRMWDMRRLVLPITYFLEKPFENWTKVGSELAGTVLIPADYRVQRAELEDLLDRLLANEPLWNGKSKSVIVYDLTDRVAVFRVVVSADDSDKLWTLRCKVREAMLAYLQQEPWRMPQTRVSQSAG